MLLKPWRNLTELKSSAETFEEAYNTFISQANEKSKRVIANIQYYYECLDAATEDRRRSKAQKNNTRPENINEDTIGIAIDDEGDIEDIYTAVTGELKEITEEDIERALIMRTQARDRLHGEIAVTLGYDFGIFEEHDESVQYTNTARKVQADEGEKIRAWDAQLKATTREQINKFGVTDVTEELNKLTPSMIIIQPQVTSDGNTLSNVGQASMSKSAQVYAERVELASLNEDQRRAHDIVEERLKEHMASE